MATDSEQQFLLAEFQSSFQHLGKLDDRIFESLQYYSAFIAGTAAASTAILSLESFDSDFRSLGIALLLLLVFVVSLTVRGVLLSQRRATERYRNKLNAIRQVFRLEATTPQVLDLWASGAAYAMNTKPVEEKHLRFLDILHRDRRCTALYVMVLVDLGAAAALIASILLICGLF